jgi:hypothetical protein
LTAETAFEMASIYIEFQFLIVGSTDTWASMQFNY